MQDMWSSLPYVVLKAHDGGAVYTIAPVHDRTKVKTVHRSLLKVLVGVGAPEVGQGGGSQGAARRVSEESCDLDLWIVSEPPLTLGTDQTFGGQPVMNPVSPGLGTPPVGTATGSSGQSPVSAGGSCVRRTSRTTAGRHPNPHNLPRSTLHP